VPGSSSATTAGPAPVRLFYSYAHEDEKLRAELERHLKILQHRGLIQPWHDRAIVPGALWDAEIAQQLLRADLVLLLLSSYFMGSDYVLGVELKTALRRAAEGSARLALVAAWLLADGELQAIGRGLPDLADRALAWLERDAPELAQVASAAAFVQDEDRREELVRLCLSGLGLVPDGETPNQAEDRLTALSSVARVRAVAAAKEKLRLAKEEAEREEARARQVREELARKAAEEAAAKGSRE